MSEGCLFCKIGAKEIPANLFYEDEEVFAFADINPQAPTHILICPRRHFASLQDATQEDTTTLGKLQLVAARLAKELKLSDGFRTVINNGSGVGQTVPHLHLHLLGGRSFQWPPG